MIEFLTNYGLWIVLTGVFFAMHWFGVGCCGGGHRRGQVGRPQSTSKESLSKGKTSEEGRDSGSRCH